MAKTPRVRAIQTLVRLIYEDGTVGAVAISPASTPIDPMEPESEAGSDATTIAQIVAEQSDALVRTIQQRGPEALYQQARADVFGRRLAAPVRDAVNKVEQPTCNAPAQASSSLPPGDNSDAQNS